MTGPVRTPTTTTTTTTDSSGFGLSVAGGGDLVALAGGSPLEVVDDPGRGHVVVPGLAVVVDEDPQVAHPERDHRHAVTDEAEERLPDGWRIAVRSDDAKPHDHLAEGLAGEGPEHHEVERDDQRNEEREDRGNGSWARRRDEILDELVDE